MRSLVLGMVVFGLAVLGANAFAQCENGQCSIGSSYYSATSYPSVQRHYSGPWVTRSVSRPTIGARVFSPYYYNSGYGYRMHLHTHSYSSSGSYGYGSAGSSAPTFYAPTTYYYSYGYESNGG